MDTEKKCGIQNKNLNKLHASVQTETEIVKPSFKKKKKIQETF